jgi:hypothetical protein
MSFSGKEAVDALLQEKFVARAVASCAFRKNKILNSNYNPAAHLKGYSTRSAVRSSTSSSYNSNLSANRYFNPLSGKFVQLNHPSDNNNNNKINASLEEDLSAPHMGHLADSDGSSPQHNPRLAQMRLNERKLKPWSLRGQEDKDFDEAKQEFDEERRDEMRQIVEDSRSRFYHHKYLLLGAAFGYYFSDDLRQNATVTLNSAKLHSYIYSVHTLFDNYHFPLFTALDKYYLRFTAPHSHLEWQRFLAWNFVFLYALSALFAKGERAQFATKSQRFLLGFASCCMYSVSSDSMQKFVQLHNLAGIEQIKANSLENAVKNYEIPYLYTIANTVLQAQSVLKLMLLLPLAFAPQKVAKVQLNLLALQIFTCFVVGNSWMNPHLSAESSGNKENAVYGFPQNWRGWAKQQLAKLAMIYSDYHALYQLYSVRYVARALSSLIGGEEDLNDWRVDIAVNNVVELKEIGLKNCEELLDFLLNGKRMKGAVARNHASIKAKLDSIFSQLPPSVVEKNHSSKNHQNSETDDEDSSEYEIDEALLKQYKFAGLSVVESNSLELHVSAVSDDQLLSNQSKVHFYLPIRSKSANKSAILCVSARVLTFKSGEFAAQALETAKSNISRPYFYPLRLAMLCSKEMLYRKGKVEAPQDFRYSKLMETLKSKAFEEISDEIDVKAGTFEALAASKLLPLMVFAMNLSRSQRDGFYVYDYALKKLSNSSETEENFFTAKLLVEYSYRFPYWSKFYSNYPHLSQLHSNEERAKYFAEKPCFSYIIADKTIGQSGNAVSVERISVIPLQDERNRKEVESFMKFMHYHHYQLDCFKGEIVKPLHFSITAEKATLPKLERCFYGASIYPLYQANATSYPLHFQLNKLTAAEMSELHSKRLALSKASEHERYMRKLVGDVPRL